MKLNRDDLRRHCCIVGGLGPSAIKQLGYMHVKARPVGLIELRLAGYRKMPALVEAGFVVDPLGTSLWLPTAAGVEYLQKLIAAGFTDVLPSVPCP